MQMVEDQPEEQENINLDYPVETLPPHCPVPIDPRLADSVFVSDNPEDTVLITPPGGLPPLHLCPKNEQHN